jgi:hypothetical protein
MYYIISLTFLESANTETGPQVGVTLYLKPLTTPESISALAGFIS